MHLDGLGVIVAKLFVGLNFANKGLLAKKVIGFRQRFDPKYNQYGFPHMAMLAPFETKDQDITDLKETLKEELDTFYYGAQASVSLGFAGLGVYQTKKKSILYLNPIYGLNLQYCSEVVLDICKSFMCKPQAYRENPSQFLPLGYFSHENDLGSVMEHAQVEFKSNGDIPIESISLYEKKHGVWIEVEALITFEKNEDKFLQLNRASI